MKQYIEVKDWKTDVSFLTDGTYEAKPVKKTRSIAQNSMYWGYVLPFIVKQYSEAWEVMTAYNLHEHIKLLVPRKRIKSDFSKSYIFQKWSTTDLSTKQFKELIEKVKALCEFWELHQLKLQYIQPFIIPDITEDDLLYWQSIIS